MNLPQGTTRRDLERIFIVLYDFENAAEKDENPEAQQAFGRASELLAHAYMPK